MIDIRTFNAEQAWKLVQLSLQDRIEQVLLQVEQRASEGEIFLNFDGGNQIEYSLMRELENRGFKVDYFSDGSIFKYTISW